MDAVTTRMLLLRQHARLRDLLNAVQTLIARFAGGEPVRDRLETRLRELRMALLEHNRTEEAAVEPLLLRDADASGTARVARMLEQHRAEHSLVTNLLDSPLEAITPAFHDLAAELVAHMEGEERTFLSVAVLR